MAHAQTIPEAVQTLSLGERIRWARLRSGLSHDRLVERLGRTNRSHLIKIERGLHIPRQDLRDALADALAVPPELFSDDVQEAALPGDPFRGAAAQPPPSDPSGDGAAVTEDAA